MEGRKKVLAVILVPIAIVIVGRSIIKRGDEGPPPSVMKHPVEMIDRDTGEFVTKPISEWKDLKQPGTKNYKNTKTDKYTLVEPMICARCGAKIPPPDYPPLNGENGVPSSALIAECKRLDAEYKCPKCGRRPFGGLVPR